MYMVSEPGEWRLVKAAQELKGPLDGFAARVEKDAVHMTHEDEAIKELQDQNAQLRRRIEALEHPSPRR
jgi:hypothetical protein